MVTYICALVLGVLLLVFCNSAQLFNWIVMAVGIALIVPCLINLVSVFFPARKEGESKMERSLDWTFAIGGIGGLIFGVILLIFPGFFARYIIYTLAVVLILCGIYQLSAVGNAIKVFGLNPWLLAVPVLTLIGGVVIIFLGPEKIQTAATIITGILLTLYAINGLIGFSSRVSHQKKLNATAENSSEN